ncbi:hypothetical protein PMAYCL1PPCAC_18735, partial [Pristionchus mayeri]
PSKADDRSLPSPFHLRNSELSNGFSVSECVIWLSSSSWQWSSPLIHSSSRVVLEFLAFPSVPRWRLNYSENEFSMLCSKWIRRDLPNGFVDGIDRRNRPVFFPSLIEL